MASPAPSSAGPASHSSSSSRWGRSGEPGSAFSGLGRGGRGGGNRGRGGPRGGRGGNRGGPPSREPKNDEPARSTKEPLSAPSLVNTKSTSSITSSVSSPKIDKSNLPPNSSKPKPASRRGSRSIPPAIVTQIKAAESPSSPQSARSPQKRRRSQAGKGNPAIPAKINPPQSNDNLVRPNRPNIGPVPHTAPVKDAPPHISNGATLHVDKRNELDSFVERCRAPRAATPGSHIDWAGDDDDSLPDLDDWGINTATFSASKSDIISPIIVDGLKPLPDLHPHLIPASPLRHSYDLETHSTTTDSLSTSLSDLKEEVAAIEVEDKKSVSSSLEKASDSSPPSVTSASADASTTQGQTSRKSDSIPASETRLPAKPIHPSLPAKPNAAPVVSHLNSRPGATPMRKNYTKPPHSANKESFNVKENKQTLPEAPASEPAATPTPDGAATPTLNPSVPKEVSVVPPTPVEKSAVEPEAAANAPVRPHTAIEKVLDSIEATGGLETSIHAPKAISDSRSAPAHMSSYPDITPAADNRPAQNNMHHQRSHTTGRPYNNRRHNGDRSPQVNRNHNFSNGGFNDSHGGFSNGHHSRTQSSPPVAAGGSSPHSRPRITGDAISRLARTINKANNTSPPKPAPSVGLNN
ncbi:hypothetical protein CVT24_009584 [Panaeolus cyanescens]|uniref:Uncharacterized protein n=1 Tax=Panaeolus cyanescens TaxID=181874 RepID=A0A409YA77_9AGAR|nr:hypothetical protein CVT24_009584 [Panaeolus cyanescens]